MSNTFRATLERLPNIVKIIMVLGVIVFISLLFPNNVKFRYQFERGQTWRYEDLEAPFDFAIKKTPEEMEVEVAELEKDFSPYYEMNMDLARQQRELFVRAFNDQLDQQGARDQFPNVAAYTDRYLNYGKLFLGRILDRGIIQLAPEHKNKGNDFVIQVVRGQVKKRQTVENLLDLKEAKALVSDSLPYSKLVDADFLLPLLDKTIIPNIIYNDTLTNKVRADIISSIPISRGKVAKGDLIIPNGGIVTDEVYQKLLSFKAKYEEEVTAKKSSWGIYTGYFLLTGLIIGVFLIYLQRYYPAIYKSFPKLIFILMWLVVYSYLVYMVEKSDALSSYLIPFAIVPIVIKTFYNERLALFTHIVVVLIASFLSSLGYEFTFLQILVGIVVLLSDINTRDFSRFLTSMIFIFLTYALAYLGLSLIQDGELALVELSVYTWLFLNVFLTLLAYPLIPLLERFFGFTSSFTLVELSDMNRPLLRDLAIKAPGTLQHSLQVANLAEVAARKIGADPLLVKVAALYHDIGKTKNAEFFIENQSGVNPHNDISNLDSAKIIIDHVVDGVKMAKKNRLPQVLIDFIKTHHGTTRTEYFYRNYMKENPDLEVDESVFRYPGPRPRTKEETILMLADSIEAATKSLKSPTERELSDFIDKIVRGKFDQGQFEESQMTFSEFKECVQVFKQIMKSVHHVRIEYPDEKKG